MIRLYLVMVVYKDEYLLKAFLCYDGYRLLGSDFTAANWGDGFLSYFLMGEFSFWVPFA